MPPVCDCLQTFFLCINTFVFKMLVYFRRNQGSSSTSDIELGSGAPTIIPTSALGNPTPTSHCEADNCRITLAARNPVHYTLAEALQRYATPPSPTTEATNLIGNCSDSPRSTASDRSSIGNTSTEVQSLDSSMTSIGAEDEGGGLQDESVEDREQVIMDMKSKFDGATAAMPLLDHKVKGSSAARTKSDWHYLLRIANAGKVTDIKGEEEEGGARGRACNKTVNSGHDDDTHEDDLMIPAHRKLKFAIGTISSRKIPNTLKEEEGEDWSNGTGSPPPHVGDPGAAHVNPSGPAILVESPTIDRTFRSVLEATEDLAVLMDSMVKSTGDPDSGTNYMGGTLGPGVGSRTPFDLGYDWFGGAVEKYYRAKTGVYSENANADLLFDDPFSDYYTVRGSGCGGYVADVSGSLDITLAQVLQPQSFPVNKSKLAVNVC